MEWIPVIDLRGGQVVHARRGERQHYAPVRSGLLAGSHPIEVAAALIEAAQARTVYVADLDAIGGGALQAPVLAALLARWPALQWWIDGGFAGAAQACAALAPAAAALRRPGALQPVFGSESFGDTGALAAALEPGACAPLGDGVLSLDRRGVPLGAVAAWDEPAWWPREMIVMTLEAVGSEAGPALGTLRQVRERAGPQRRLIGAGGVRDAEDLAAATTAGADAWLLATALHNGRLRHPAGAAPDGRAGNEAADAS
jgi:phosphoribosylformimino-5-aminoimidazole carboxamide ribotide isomerase